MKRPLLGIAAVIAAVAFAAPVWAACTATDFSSARTAYSQKKADCKERSRTASQARTNACVQGAAESRPA